MKEYPRTQKYDRDWIDSIRMGPNAMLLMEELCGNLDLRPGMKVLDMGCGRGLSSVFLAKEYGVTVFACDLWTNPTDNLRIFEEAGVADRVFPLKAEAHALPFANGFFDAAVAIGSYHYFGTDETYFPCIYAKLVRPGGQFGIVVPGFTKEYEKGQPDWQLAFIAAKREKHGESWGEDMFAFHSNPWWRRHWEKHGIAEITACYDIEDAHGIWRHHDGWVEYIDGDTDHDIAFVVMAAKKK